VTEYLGVRTAVFLAGANLADTLLVELIEMLSERGSLHGIKLYICYIE
jgi:hypothetical protein